MVVSWFSAGVSSAVATKIANPDKIIYIDIDDQHSDTYRFIADCEKWFGKKIDVLKSKYKNVENVCLALGHVKGWKGGVPCTSRLKQLVRKEWENQNPGRHSYVWGFDRNEKERSFRLVAAMPKYNHQFPILEFSKPEVHGMLEAAGIKRPAMYDLGYHNNNCIGCLRGGMGYWNKIRIDFPNVFLSRMLMERKVGHHILKECFLDELDPNRGRHEDMIIPDCGMFCEIQEAHPCAERPPQDTAEAGSTAYNSARHESRAENNNRS